MVTKPVLKPQTSGPRASPGLGQTRAQTSPRCCTQRPLSTPPQQPGRPRPLERRVLQRPGPAPSPHHGAPSSPLVGSRRLGSARLGSLTHLGGGGAAQGRPGELPAAARRCSAGCSARAGGAGPAPQAGLMARSGPCPRRSPRGRAAGGRRSEPGAPPPRSFRFRRRRLQPAPAGGARRPAAASTNFPPGRELRALSPPGGRLRCRRPRQPGGGRGRRGEGRSAACRVLLSPPEPE